MYNIYELISYLCENGIARVGKKSVGLKGDERLAIFVR